MAICKKCSGEFPDKRKEIGYSICLDCSTEERWSAVPVTYHKTGNTIEVVKDPDDAATITAMMSRKGFGVMNGLKGVRTRSSDKGAPVIARLTPNADAPKTLEGGRIVGRRKMPLDYEGVGNAMMSALEAEGREAALRVIDDAESAWKILPRQAVQLRSIIENLVS